MYKLFFSPLDTQPSDYWHPGEKNCFSRVSVEIWITHSEICITISYKTVHKLLGLTIILWQKNVSKALSMLSQRCFQRTFSTGSCPTKGTRSQVLCYSQVVFNYTIKEFRILNNSLISFLYTALLKKSQIKCKNMGKDSPKISRMVSNNTNAWHNKAACMPANNLLPAAIFTSIGLSTYWYK